MATHSKLKPAVACANSGCPMPSRGRPAVSRTGACRKPANEARRTEKPDAFELKIITREVVVEPDLTQCVTRVTASRPHCNMSRGNGPHPVTPPEGYLGPWPPPWWPRP